MGWPLRSTFAELVSGIAPPHLAAMRIACPACSAEYDVPEAMLGATPRPMRCARCQHVWTPAAIEHELLEATPFETMQHEAGTRAATGRPKPPPLPIEIEPPSRALVMTEPVGTRLLAPDPPNRRALGVAWVLTVAVILAGLVGAVAQRDAVMAAWPPAARAYAAIGLN
ncbi:MAG: zinc-ribbon domain-containing protein [Pseudomonadota bacterium]